MITKNYLNSEYLLTALWLNKPQGKVDVGADGPYYYLNYFYKKYFGTISCFESDGFIAYSNE